MIDILLKHTQLSKYIEELLKNYTHFNQIYCRFFYKNRLTNFGLSSDDIAIRNKLNNYDRKLSYQNGRISLNLALKNLYKTDYKGGYTEPNIKDSADSESNLPVLPDKVVGNISHSFNLAVAVVASRDSYHSVGVDVQHLQSNLTAHKKDKLLRRICNSQEIKKLSVKNILNSEINPIVLFSQKEAVYKCCYLANIRIKSWHEINLQDTDIFAKCFNPSLFSAIINNLIIYGLTISLNVTLSQKTSPIKFILSLCYLQDN